MRNKSLGLWARAALILLLGAVLWLALLSQAQHEGTFDDDDPTNDPNTCHTDPDPHNCDWVRGWFQAALNVGHITLESAKITYPDMQVTDWLPDYLRVEQERQRQLFEDDDPSNDPNDCHASIDPDCDWNQGWLQAYVNLYKPVIDLDFEYEKASDEADKVKISRTECGTTLILLGLSADLAETNPDAYNSDCDPDPITDIRWFCPEGFERDPKIQGPNCDKKRGE